MINWLKKILGIKTEVFTSLEIEIYERQSSLLAKQIAARDALGEKYSCHDSGSLRMRAKRPWTAGRTLDAEPKFEAEFGPPPKIDPMHASDYGLLEYARFKRRTEELARSIDKVERLKW